MSASSLSIFQEWNISLEKQIGEGVCGIVYLVTSTIDGTPSVLKRQYVDSSKLIKNNEVKVNILLQTLIPSHKQFFVPYSRVKLHRDDSFKKPPTPYEKYFDKEIVTHLQDLRNAGNVLDMQMELKQQSLTDFLKLKLSSLNAMQKVSIILQCLSTVWILRGLELSHTDLHPGNIMVDEIDTKINIVLKEEISFKTGGVKVSIIDYGEVYNKEFKYRNSDIKTLKRTMHKNNMDWFSIIRYVCCVEGLLRKETNDTPIDIISNLCEVFVKNRALYEKVKILFFVLFDKNDINEINWFSHFEEQSVESLRFCKEDEGNAFELLQLVCILNKPFYCEVMKHDYMIPNLLNEEDLLVISLHRFQDLVFPISYLHKIMERSSVTRINQKSHI